MGDSANQGFVMHQAFVLCSLHLSNISVHAQYISQSFLSASEQNRPSCSRYGGIVVAHASNNLLRTVQIERLSGTASIILVERHIIFTNM